MAAVTSLLVSPLTTDKFTSSALSFTFFLIRIICFLLFTELNKKTCQIVLRITSVFIGFLKADCFSHIISSSPFTSISATRTVAEPRRLRVSKLNTSGCQDTSPPPVLPPAASHAQQLHCLSCRKQKKSFIFVPNTD